MYSFKGRSSPTSGVSSPFGTHSFCHPAYTRLQPLGTATTLLYTPSSSPIVQMARSAEPLPCVPQESSPPLILFTDAPPGKHSMLANPNEGMAATISHGKKRRRETKEIGPAQHNSTDADITPQTTPHDFESDLDSASPLPTKRLKVRETPAGEEDEVLFRPNPRKRLLKKVLVRKISKTASRLELARTKMKTLLRLRLPKRSAETRARLRPRRRIRIPASRLLTTRYSGSSMAWRRSMIGAARISLQMIAK